MKKNISIVLLTIIVIVLCVVIIKKDKVEPKVEPKVEIATEEVATHEPEPELTEEEKYQEWIDSCFDSNGTCPALISLVQANVNDPASVVSYRTGYKEKVNIDYLYKGIVVVMEFGAANRMGGMVRAQVTAELNYEKGTIKIIEWDE